MIRGSQFTTALHVSFGRILLLCAMAVCGQLRGEEITAEDGRGHEEYFERFVRPLLVKHCYECHSAESDDPGGGLRVDSATGLRGGGESGSALQPGDPDRSLLIRAVRYTDPLLQMPPDEKLSAREIEILTQWVLGGAYDPRQDESETTFTPTARPPADADLEAWWSFQPIQAIEVPGLSEGARGSVRVENPVDHFWLEKLDRMGIGQPPLADRRTLIRRATFDLTGLPPTPEEVEQFVADIRPDAWGRLIDRLLGSPHYGQRWGRHWLDVVRYADTSGCNGDFPVPDAFRYRNYVVDSLNRDKPYDRFVREQLAGDLLPHDSEQQRLEQLVATGYLAISRRFSSLGEEFHLTLDDTIDNLGKAFLGLSISCARCHAHKFDPIPQQDYYALYGIFQSTTYSFPGTEIYRHTQDLIPLVSEARLNDELEPYLSRMRELDAEIYQTYTRMAEMDTGPERDALRKKWQEYQKERDQIVRELPEFPRAYGAREGSPTDAPLHIKGEPTQLGDPVPRGFLRILGGQRVPDDSSGSGRAELAEWISSERNPLTARVMVNRVWLHHFGQGLVTTPDDFGTRGARPSHPELLDYLSDRFISEGWSLKRLHRLIMSSAAYQSAWREDAEYTRRDPENQSLWHFPRRRLSAEEIRDAMLAVSGALDNSQGRQHPFPPELEWRYTQHKPFVDDYPTRRRSLYLMQQRIRQQPYLAVFDGADTNAVIGMRKVSTTPQQALFMMNSPFVQEQAERLLERLQTEDGDTASRIRRAYQVCFQRDPDEGELAEGLEFLSQWRRFDIAAGRSPSEETTSQDVPPPAWTSLLRVLLSSNEFVFVE